MMTRRTLSVLALGAACGLAACDTSTLLEVEDPDVALPAALRDTLNLNAVRGFGIGAARFGGGLLHHRSSPVVFGDLFVLGVVVSHFGLPVAAWSRSPPLPGIVPA